MPIHAMPIQQRIGRLIHHTDRHSRGFRSLESWLARCRYLSGHPADIAAFKCMDGRINIPAATGTPYAIIETNMRTGRIPDDGFLLLAETPYRDIGVRHARTELKSLFLRGFAADVIRAEFPKPAEKMHVLTAVPASQSRTMEVIDGCAA